MLTRHHTRPGVLSWSDCDVLKEARHPLLWCPATLLCQPRVRLSCASFPHRPCVPQPLRCLTHTHPLPPNLWWSASVAHHPRHGRRKPAGPDVCRSWVLRALMTVVSSGEVQSRTATHITYVDHVTPKGDQLAKRQEAPPPQV